MKWVMHHQLFSWRETIGSLPSLSSSTAWNVDVMAGTAWSSHLNSEVWASFEDGGVRVLDGYGAATSALGCQCLWERTHLELFKATVIWAFGRLQQNPILIIISQLIQRSRDMTVKRYEHFRRQTQDPERMGVPINNSFKKWHAFQNKEGKQPSLLVSNTKDGQGKPLISHYSPMKKT